MKIVSVNIGEKRKVKWRNKIVETGIFKFPVQKPIFLDIEDVKNDDVVDRKYHGGIEQAVYAYGEQHYAYWKGLYPKQAWTYGMFGENLTVTNLDETNIHVGSTYQLGEAIIEVTKPREPCYKLGIRFNDPSVIKQFWNSTKSGIYFKILKTGYVGKSEEMILLNKPINNPTIAEVYVSKRLKKGK
ncbi:MAG: MOSC domain-containing protein [Aureibaculum sp.]|nr:MOSC domain-containing protein [Aureibaculum sp.]